MSSLRPRPQVPQELQDTIVLLVNLPQDLRSCALAYPSLLPIARSLLFRNIIIIQVRHPRNSTDDPLTEVEDRAYTNSAFRRLAEVLISAPGVKRFIHSLTFAATLDVAILLADMNLSSLAEINIFGNEEDALSGNLVGPLQRLIGIPSLRVIELNAGLSAQIFQLCNPDLTDLMFENAEVQIPMDIPKLPDEVRRPALAHLSLDNSLDTADWLIHPDCPFQLTHLVGLVIVGSLSDNARLIVASARQTITDLTLSAEDLIWALLDLGQLPVLTDLHLSMSHVCEMIYILPSLSEIDRENIIQTISLELESFDLDDLTPHVKANLIGFDSGFDKLPLPRLKELILDLPRPAPGHEDETRQRFYLALPLLHERCSGSDVAE